MVMDFLDCSIHMKSLKSKSGETEEDAAPHPPKKIWQRRRRFYLGEKFSEGVWARSGIELWLLYP